MYKARRNPTTERWHVVNEDELPRLVWSPDGTGYATEQEAQLLADVLEYETRTFLMQLVKTGRQAAQGWIQFWDQAN